MPLADGTRLGVFEILAPLGKGGRGEVYRARDTNLERERVLELEAQLSRPVDAGVAARHFQLGEALVGRDELEAARGHYIRAAA